MDTNDISKLSQEDKDALLQELITKLNSKEQEEPQSKAKVKKISPGNKKSISKGTHIVEPIDKREHYNTFEDIAKTIKVENDDQIRKEDQKYWQNRVPSERRQEAELYEAQCKRCGRTHQVYASDLRNDPDEGMVYYCNKCSAYGGR